MSTQASLFEPPAPAQPRLDLRFSKLERLFLDERCWVDVAPGWVEGSRPLFGKLVAERPWKQRTRWLYDKKMIEPRLTAPWYRGSPEALEPIVEQMRAALSAHYGVDFNSVGFNYYRDGDDSVAWHGDKIRRDIEEPIVALVSLGEPRKFLLRPRGGGRSRPFMLGDGDLLVTGGRTQREWQHCVPKVAHAGPRISLAFRYGMDARAYGD